MVIVAAVDRSDRATDVIAQAEQLANAFDDPIHAVHVLSSSEFVNLERTSLQETGEVQDMDRIREVAANIAADAASNIAADVPSEIVGLMGDAADNIVDYAADQNARYIVVAGRKRSPTGKVIFGSVAQSILLNAKCPVVTTLE